MHYFYFIFEDMVEGLDVYKKETVFLQINDESIMSLISDVPLSLSKREQAVILFYKVRDFFLYDPYHLDIRPSALISSSIMKKRRAWCVEKAIVLATGFRALGIPSKLGFGIVVNHIGVDRLTTKLKRKEIVFHGYVSAYIEERWVKATPAFDKNVCRISGVLPLEWDGETDALLQAYHGDRKFMEYIHFYGDFEDVPVQLMNEEMRKYYPHLFEKEYASKEFSFFHM